MQLGESAVRRAGAPSGARPSAPPAHPGYSIGKGRPDRERQTNPLACARAPPRHLRRVAPAGWPVCRSEKLCLTQRAQSRGGHPPAHACMAGIMAPQGDRSDWVGVRSGVPRSRQGARRHRWVPRDRTTSLLEGAPPGTIPPACPAPPPDPSACSAALRAFCEIRLPKTVTEQERRGYAKVVARRLCGSATDKKAAPPESVCRSRFGSPSARGSWWITTVRERAPTRRVRVRELRIGGAA